jgi:hypothetical protein
MSWSWFRSRYIVNMSLNSLRRRVATRDKTLTDPQWMNRLLNWIYSNGFQLVGPLCYHFVEEKNVFWRIYGTRVFLSEAQYNF